LILFDIFVAGFKSQANQFQDLGENHMDMRALYLKYILFILIALIGCIGPESAELNTLTSAQPLELDIGISSVSLVAGESVDIEVDGLTPATVVRMYRNTGGLGDGLCFGGGSLCLDLLPPLSMAGAAMSDGEGRAVVSVSVPPLPEGATVCFQARGILDSAPALSEAVCGVLTIADHCITPMVADWFVATDGLNSNSGSSAEEPLRNIAVALNRANTGEVVEVGPGIYYPINSLNMPSNVTLISRDGPELTAIDGSALSCGFNCPAGLFEMNHRSQLIGFSIWNVANSYAINSNGKFEVQIARNVLDTGCHSGIRLDGGGQVEIIQNTIVNNTWGGITYGSSAGTTTVRNNIIAFHPEAGIDNDNWGDDWDIDYNLFYNPGAGYGETRVDNGVGDNNLMGIDPLFSGSDSGDFSLIGASAAINSGELVYGIDPDCAIPDMGAIPYNGNDEGEEEVELWGTVLYWGKLVHVDLLTGEVTEYTDLGLGQPTGLSFDWEGNLRIADIVNDAVEIYDADGVHSTFYDFGSAFANPRGLEVGEEGNWYVTTTIPRGIYHLTADGSGSLLSEFGFLELMDIAIDDDHNFWVTDNHTAEDGALLELESSGAWWESRATGLVGPRGLDFGPDGLLYIASSGTWSDMMYTGGRVLQYNTVTGAGPDVIYEGTSGATALQFGESGAMYVAHQEGGVPVIERFWPDGSREILAYTPDDQALAGIAFPKVGLSWP
jgi:parallel beta-helix repeat protein